MRRGHTTSRPVTLSSSRPFPCPYCGGKVTVVSSRRSRLKSFGPDGRHFEGECDKGHKVWRHGTEREGNPAWWKESDPHPKGCS
jgi:hypothetical protein